LNSAFFFSTTIQYSQVPTLKKITVLLSNAAAATKNPHYSHNLFEAVAVIIRTASMNSAFVIDMGNNASTTNRGGNTRKSIGGKNLIPQKTDSNFQAVEKDLLNLCNQILANNVADFIPYAFQVLGLLLESGADQVAF
jgi:hypothetical protein